MFSMATAGESGLVAESLRISSRFRAVAIIVLPLWLVFCSFFSGSVS